jgi:cobalt-zinc-cadmium efflux system outer membrane protein
MRMPATSVATLALLSLIVGTSLGQTVRTRQPEAVYAAPAHGAPPNETVTFTLSDLEQIAFQRNPILAQAAAQIAASRGAALEAGLYPNPIIGYEGEQIGAAGELQGGFVQQTIVTAGKLRLSRAKYNQEAFEASILATGQQLTVLVIR